MSGRKCNAHFHHKVAALHLSSSVVFHQHYSRLHAQNDFCAPMNKISLISNICTNAELILEFLVSSLGPPGGRQRYYTNLHLQHKCLWHKGASWFIFWRIESAFVQEFFTKSTFDYSHC